LALPRTSQRDYLARMERARFRSFARSRVATALLASIGLFTVGLMVWPGCAFMPLPSKRTPIASRTTAQFKLKQPEQLTRAEILARLGQPDQYYPDIRVACYRVNNVKKRELFLLLFVIPVRVQGSHAYDIGFVEFDEQDRVRRAAVSTYSAGTELKSAANDWLKK
jgi:hypothetical protein